MAISQFTPALRESIFKTFADTSNKVDLASFGKLTRKQLFKVAPETKDIRSRFQAADYHTSSITIDGITALNQKLVTTVQDAGARKVVENLLLNDNFFTDFLAYVEQKESVLEFGAGDFRIENIPERNLRNIFIDYLRENLTGISPAVVEALGKNVQSGHLAGVVFLKLKTALGVKTTFKTSTTETYRDFTVSMDDTVDPRAVEILDSVLKAVLDADYLTSNLTTQSQVFIDATKSVLGDSPKLITELQFELDNRKSGELLTKTGNELNKLIKAATKGEMGSAEKAIEQLVKSLKPVADLILQKAEELKEPLQAQGIYSKIVSNANYLTNTLINTPGSVTIKDGIGQSLANVIKTGKVKPASTTKIKPKPIRTVHREVLNISQVASEFKKAVTTLKKAVDSTKFSKTARVRATKPKTTVPLNLSSLLAYFNANIQNVVSANMGDGSSRDILNYRTGRFAASVKVEQLTMGREGMLTAYYTYMKNPYATFSEGGRQEFPRSRDPKLLISKSIREIAQERAITRLRAVLV